MILKKGIISEIIEINYNPFLWLKCRAGICFYILGTDFFSFVKKEINRFFKGKPVCNM